MWIVRRWGGNGECGLFAGGGVMGLNGRYVWSCRVVLEVHGSSRTILGEEPLPQWHCVKGVRRGGTRPRRGRSLGEHRFVDHQFVFSVSSSAMRELNHHQHYSNLDKRYSNLDKRAQLFWFWFVCFHLAGCSYKYRHTTIIVGRS